MPKTPNLGNYRSKSTVAQSISAGLILITVLVTFGLVYVKWSADRKDIDRQLERSERLSRRW
jgi:hypothetical protein